MAPSKGSGRHRWQCSLGKSTIQRIVRQLIPSWTNGLHDWQLDIVSRLLDGEDVLLITATGDGKSAIFGIPVLVLLEVARNPLYYPDFPYPEKPVGLVITPTKGLSANIVFELGNIGVKALAYDSDTLTEARKTGRSLVSEIAECSWPIVCIDPEHLVGKEWEAITAHPSFRSNVRFVSVDETHLIIYWGLSFRPPFRHIGAFVRGRLSSLNVAVAGLTATLQPGPDTHFVCESLGFVRGNFHLLRRSNERHNIQFVLSPLSHGLEGHEFPDLLQYLIANRKTIIYCATIELCWRVAVYLWRFMPPGPEKLRRIRLYHSMCWPDENEETVRLIRDDPQCQIVIATIAFGQGFNVKSLLDSIQLGVAATLDQVEQEKGRVGRDLNTVARGIVLVQPTAIEAARKYLSTHNKSASLIPQKTKSNRSKATVSIDHARALLLVETGCLIAFLNRTYGNASPTSKLDCILADRPLPCSNCLPRFDKTLKFTSSPLPADVGPLPAFPKSSPTASRVKPPRKKHVLTKKMQEEAQKELESFAHDLHKREMDADVYGYRPRSSYLPHPAITSLIDALSTITTADDLQNIIPEWRYHSQHGTRLLTLLAQLRCTFDAQQNEARLLRNAKSRARTQAHRSIEMSDTSNSLSEPSSNDPSPVPPTPIATAPADLELLRVPPQETSGTILHKGQKRPALSSSINLPTKRMARAPLQSSVEVSKTFGPAYRVRSHIGSSNLDDENSGPLTETRRRSTRLSRR